MKQSPVQLQNRMMNSDSIIEQKPSKDLSLAASNKKKKKTGHTAVKTCSTNNIQPKVFLLEALPAENNKLGQTRADLLR